MSVTDYIIDTLLIIIVLRQTRGSELTVRSVLLPVVLVAGACVNYIRAFIPHGNDLLLIAVLVLVGAVLGLLSGLLTDVWQDKDGRVMAQAGLGAAAMWIVGMGSRFGFAVWSTGAGRVHVGEFSARHQISSGQVWTTALVGMAVGEVLARVIVLQLRRALAAGDRSLVSAQPDGASSQR